VDFSSRNNEHLTSIGAPDPVENRDLGGGDPCLAEQFAFADRLEGGVPAYKF
jgi:hypothetical protein